MLKNLKEPPFHSFRPCEIFQSNNFCLKVRFSQAQHAISDFFSKTGVFHMRLFQFSFHRSPPSIFTKNETFCDSKGLVKVSGTMRLQKNCRCPSKKFFENILEKFRKIFEKKISFNFLFFFKGFPLRKMGFLLFSVGEEWFSRLMPIPSGIFWRCKIDEILTYSFYPWFYV